MAKYNFTISGNSLLMQRTPISEDTQYKAISFKSPSLVQDNNKIKLFEAGEFQTSLRFIDFGLIDGISPIDLQDAKDKLLVLIGTISEGGGEVNVQADLLEEDNTQDSYVRGKEILLRTFIKSNENLTNAQRKDDTLYGILDQYTGEEITLTLTDDTNDADGVIYFDLGAEKFKRVFNQLNVKWFGAKGDGATDDTTAIQNAINSVTAQGATLYFPAGIYLIPNGGLTCDKQILFQGEGRNEFEFTPTYTVNRKGSTISTSSATAILLASSQEGTSFQNIAFECTATTPTAGAGIVLNPAGSFTMDKISVKGFYDNLRIFDGTRWSVSDSNFYFPAHYGILIDNDANVISLSDTGDNSIVGVNVVVNKSGVTGIKYKSSGGLKIVNTKVNPSNAERVNVCIDLEASGDTDQLMISNCSLEGFSGRAIKMSSPTGKVFDSTIIVGNQLRSHTATVTCVEIQGNSEAIRNVLFSDNLIKKTHNDAETDPAIIVDGVSQLNMSGNQIIGFVNKKTVTNTGYVYDLDPEGMNYYGQLGVANNFPTKGYRGFSNQGISLITDLSGVLVETDIDTSVNMIMNLIVTGANATNAAPIDFNMSLIPTGSGSIIYPNLLNKGDGIISAKAFYLSGKLYFWIEPKYSYSSFNFEIQTNDKKANIISSSVGAIPGGATGTVTFTIF